MNAPVSVPMTVDKAPLVAGARPKPIVPTDIDQVWRLAQIIVKSGLAPKDMQKPETITVAIMHGLEVGLSPLMALQRIAVINGRPSIWGDAAIGLVRASGFCEFVAEMITGEGDEMVAICRAKRKSEKDFIERTFSVADAKKAGLWGKAGTWQQYPKRMLQMRARAFTLRDLFADVLGGLYITEELEGMEEERPLKDVTPRPVIKGQRAELPPALPPRETPEASEEQITETPVPATDKKPLPPLAKGARKESDGIPPGLRRSCPPADEPEAFRAWVLDRLSRCKTDEDVQMLWDSHIHPNMVNSQIMAPDLKDIHDIFAKRREEIAAR